MKMRFDVALGIVASICILLAGCSNLPRARQGDLGQLLDKEFRELGLPDQTPKSPPFEARFFVKGRDTNGIVVIIRDKDMPQMTTYLTSWLGLPYRQSKMHILYGVKDIGLAVLVVYTDSDELDLTAIEPQSRRSLLGK